MALDATPKGTSSNSYATRADADAYFADIYAPAAWSTATNANKDAALVKATSRLEQEDYFGSPTTIEQRLKWPRFGTYDSDGRLFSQDLVPRPVKEATFELADALLAGTATVADTGLEGFESVSVGPVTVRPRHARRSNELPENVIRILEPVRIGAARLNTPIIRG